MNPLAESVAPRSTGLPQLERSLEDGIERVRCRPAKDTGRPPLLLLHGMWHGAWCWREWQIQLAERGWDSHAFSLPGHGGSAPGRHPRYVGLGYYQRFVQAEIDRLAERPVLVGHSMGGGLIQRLLKAQDDFPAAVLLAPILARQMLSVVLGRFREDFWGSLACFLTGTTTPSIRNAEQVRRMFLSSSSTIEPEELRAQLSPESLLVLLQHNPPFWRPPRRVRTPMLWLACALDNVMRVNSSLRSARTLGARAEVVPDTGHDLMFDRNGPLTVQRIHDWLAQLGLAGGSEPLPWPQPETITASEAV